MGSQSDAVDYLIQYRAKLVSTAATILICLARSRITLTKDTHQRRSRRTVPGYDHRTCCRSKYWIALCRCQQLFVSKTSTTATNSLDCLWRRDRC